MSFDSASLDSQFQGKPCAIRYSGTTYKLVFFGFPLYYIKLDEAKALAVEVLDFLEE